MPACRDPILSTDPAKASATTNRPVIPDGSYAAGGQASMCNYAGEGTPGERASPPLRAGLRMATGGFQHLPS